MNKYRISVAPEHEKEVTILGRAVKVRRVIAQMDVPEWAVDVGDLGGYVENDYNLSQEGSCWISGNAIVCGDARVYGNAIVNRNALVCGDARVYGNARVTGNCKVSGNAVVQNIARIDGHSRVEGNVTVGGLSVVEGASIIHENAYVLGSSVISGEAEIRDNCTIRGSNVGGNAVIRGSVEVHDSNIYGGARITEQKDYFSVTSERGRITFYKVYSNHSQIGATIGHERWDSIGRFFNPRANRYASVREYPNFAEKLKALRPLIQAYFPEINLSQLISEAR